MPETTLFCIVQEAVNNALKHAQATQIAVHLKETPAELCVAVMDNGIGFGEPHRRPGERFESGLVTSKKRTGLTS